MGQRKSLPILYATQKGKQRHKEDMRFDPTEIAPGVAEVLCYGTAVVVEKNQ